MPPIDQFLQDLYHHAAANRNGTPARSFEQSFADFAKVLVSRHDEGRLIYGDTSSQRPVSEIVSEINEELIDVPGWTLFTQRPELSSELRERLMRLAAASFWQWLEARAIQEELRK